MPVIESLNAREILDSRGRPTIGVTCTLAGGASAWASVPSGASTGRAEALELRDGDNSRYAGLGCRRAAENVNLAISKQLSGREFSTQSDLDRALLELDGTTNKSGLGANAILAVSIAFARATAKHKGMRLYRHFADLLGEPPRLPRLTVNLFSGGKHAGGQVQVQDVLVVPIAATTIDESLAATYAVYQAAIELSRRRYAARPLVADEGGLAPPFEHVGAMLTSATDSIRAAGFEPGRDVALAIDVASSHFYVNGRYRLADVPLTSRQMIDQVAGWVERFPIVSVEDGLAEDDWENWPALRQTIAGRAIVMGDDLLCTNLARIRRAMESESADALLLKVNQIGTITEAAESCKLARSAGWAVTVSARSGETEDDWLADLAVGWAGDYIKVGSITRSERLAKYNRLLEIESEAALDLAPRGAPDKLANRHAVIFLARGRIMMRFVSFIAFSAIALIGASLLAGDWPQFLGPARNGVSLEADLPDHFPAGGPKLVWKKDVGQGFSGPVVSAGKLILFHRLGNKETVECLDARTGSPVWFYDYPTHYQDDFGFDEGPRATPTIADGKVYTFGAEGVLSSWEFASGKRLWQIDTKDQFTAPKGFFGLACSPLVEGGAVIVNIGGGKGAGIVAFDKSTGKLLWKATDDEASYSSPVAATFNGKRYILALDREGLVALDPAIGKVFFNFHWRSRSNESVNAATPLVIGNDIFISASYGTGAALLKFRESGPEVIWSADNILSNHYATSVYHDGFLYGFDGRQESGANLRCVDAKTGKVRWSQDHFGAGTLMLAGDKLLILTEKGELILAPASPDGYKASSHAQILPFNSRAYPALADGLYYARSKDKLVCIDLRGK